MIMKNVRLVDGRIGRMNLFRIARTKKSVLIHHVLLDQENTVRLDITIVTMTDTDETQMMVGQHKDKTLTGIRNQGNADQYRTQYQQHRLRTTSRLT